MATTELQIKLEFLTKFFSEPDNELMEQIRLGETPLGKIEESETELSFADEKMVMLTDLFVNSQNARPVFPLATENLADKREKENYLDALITYYAKDKKVATNYPPDHLKVQFEYLLFKLSCNEMSGAKDFYTIFLKPWYNIFTNAIVKRSDDMVALRVAALVKETMIQIEEI